MVKITIPKWRERLPRATYKSMPWIKLSSRTYRVREMYLASTSVRWTYIAVLCIVAEDAASEGWLEAPIEWWEQATNSENIVQDLQFLANAGLILLENLDPTYLSSTRQVRAKYTTSTDVCSKCALEKEKEREKEKEKTEEERKGESLREPIFDAAAGGSSRSGKSGSQKSRSKTVQVMDLSDQELELGTEWLKYAVTHFPNRTSDPKWTPDQFALELRKVANVCSFTLADMRTILDYVKHDTFWAPKCCAPNGLLKKGSNGMRKVENIFAQTKSKAQIKDAQTASDWAENPQLANDWAEMLDWIGGKKP